MPKKHNIEICKKEAEKFGGVCLEENYTNTTTKMLWQCKEKHPPFKALFKSVLKGHWCPYCSGNRKYDEEYVREKLKQAGVPI